MKKKRLCPNCKIELTEILPVILEENEEYSFITVKQNYEGGKEDWHHYALLECSKCGLAILWRVKKNDKN